jgi:hypothetical protein
MVFDDWSARKRAVALNLIGSLSLAIYFSSADVKLPADYYAYTSVYLLAFLNFMFLVVRPRVLTARRANINGNIYHILLYSSRGKGFIVLLVLIQLAGTSQSTGASAKFFVSASSQYVRSLPNASAIGHRMFGMCVAMATVALAWLLSAIGLWLGRRWAWWLALILNGLDVLVTILVTVLLSFKKQEFAIGWREIAGLVALILLMLPALRKQFLGPTREVAYP